ncbi:putative glycosyl transferase [Clostridium ragsdalei P11]|uniref:Putative glycosyl transferase n=1 Tax=Clostridium ragsdalei P11 TaxID=1353534 RepID=A0A1A6AIL1_9CLOT|nr:glycosyltransferase family 2 protein [Clostridium ragsdalei]OBR89892.1 putative glycosyl transferase [Clostridium ragsdalei P11]
MKGFDGMRILVLFTCFNRKDKTLTCVNTLITNNNIDLDFIVVDDSSSDGTTEALEKYHNIEVITGTGNLFYSGGMRVAIEAAKRRNLADYDYVMFINDDVRFYDLAVSKLVDYLAGEQAILVGATCDDTGKLSYGGSIKTSKWRPRYKNVMSGTERVYCDTFCANCVLIPKEIFRKLDNIDPVYHHAMGDFDYGCEARRNGVQIIASDFFVGVCNDNSRDNTWRDSNLSIRARIRKKESPKGLPIKEWFYYLKKNHSILTAIIYSISAYVKIFLKR